MAMGRIYWAYFGIFLPILIYILSTQIDFVGTLMKSISDIATSLFDSMQVGKYVAGTVPISGAIFLTLISAIIGYFIKK